MSHPSGEDGNFIDKDMATDNMIPDSAHTRPRPEELVGIVKTAPPKMTSAQIVMSTKIPSTARKTTPHQTTRKETTPERQTTRVLTTTQRTTEAVAMTTEQVMTVAPEVDVDSPVYFDGMHIYSYPNAVTES